MIFNRRDVSPAGRTQTMFDDLNAPTYNERLAWIIGFSEPPNPKAASRFHGNGYGGGEVTLEAMSAEALKLRSGDWVMLMQNLSKGKPYSPLFRWYRVAESESPYWDGTQYLEGRPIDHTIPGNQSRPGNFERDVTLIGPDWPWLATADSISGVPVIYATLVTGVVAVYEKTIRLESSSLW